MSQVNAAVLSVFCPLMMFPIISYLELATTEETHKLLNREFKLDTKRAVIHFLSIVQACATVYIYFIPFYSRFFRAYNVVGPIIHFILVHLVFVVIPATAIVLGYLLFNWHDSIGSSISVVFYAQLSIIILYNYVSVILRIVKGTIQFYKSGQSSYIDAPMESMENSSHHQ